MHVVNSDLFQPSDGQNVPFIDSPIKHGDFPYLFVSTSHFHHLLIEFLWIPSLHGEFPHISTIFVGEIGEILEISQPREVCFDPEGFDLLRWYDPKNDVKCRNGEESWRSWLL